MSINSQKFILSSTKLSLTIPIAPYNDNFSLDWYIALKSDGSYVDPTTLTTPLELTFSGRVGDTETFREFDNNPYIAADVYEVKWTNHVTSHLKLSANAIDPEYNVIINVHTK